MRKKTKKKFQYGGSNYNNKKSRKEKIVNWVGTKASGIKDAGSAVKKAIKDAGIATGKGIKDVGIATGKGIKDGVIFSVKNPLQVPGKILDGTEKALSYTGDKIDNAGNAISDYQKKLKEGVNKCNFDLLYKGSYKCSAYTSKSKCTKEDIVDKLSGKSDRSGSKGVHMLIKKEKNDKYIENYLKKAIFNYVDRSQFQIETKTDENDDDEDKGDEDKGDEDKDEETKDKKKNNIRRQATISDILLILDCMNYKIGNMFITFYKFNNYKFLKDSENYKEWNGREKSDEDFNNNSFDDYKKQFREVVLNKIVNFIVEIIIKSFVQYKSKHKDKLNMMENFNGFLSKINITLDGKNLMTEYDKLFTNPTKKNYNEFKKLFINILNFNFDNKIKDTESTKDKIDKLYSDYLVQRKSQTDQMLDMMLDKKRSNKYLMFVLGMLIFALLAKFNVFAAPPGISSGTF